MASSRKKVIVRTSTGGHPDTLHPGYLPPAGLLSPGLAPASLSLDLLDLEGRILPIPFASVRSIAFVRDFNLADKLNPERLTRRTFLSRPRAEGLWLRLTLVGGTSGTEVLEGLAPLDLTLLDNLLDDRGLFLLPPDIRSNTQRLFIPRHAIAALQLLAVITTPSKPKPTLDFPQNSLFP